jgi:hypothetical protein
MALAALEPATFPEFIRLVTPCLALVAPAGMSEGDKDAWFDAAYIALGHLPADMLADGATKAIRTADHPSKIVPAITAATAEWLAGRRRFAEAARPSHALPAPSKHRQSPEERASVTRKMGSLVAELVARNGDMMNGRGNKA